MKAYCLRAIDKMKTFLQRQMLKRAVDAKEERSDGKIYYKYTDVKEIYDYEKEERKILGYYTDEDTESKFDRLRQVAKRVEELRKRGELDGL